ncbi:barstar family protein [Butyrivibrio sp. FCS014]|uniref:barstar family protein n=1 Tax=Butyrivibrio sp. FCS014 TaxID=1408304 RepID=UPI000465B92F|nr:barstar family protein [Butyrivibrio sp. FCS014]
MEKVFYIDLKDITNKSELHRLLSRELPLPDYYGNNLDALYDVLTDNGDSWNLIFYNQPKSPSEEFEKYLGKLRKMCARAASECDNLQIRFFP